MAGSSVTVLAPGLLGPWPKGLHREVAGGLHAPALTRLLQRASRSPAAPEAMSAPSAEPWSFEALLLEAMFPVNPWRRDLPGGDEPAFYPFAALTYAGDSPGRDPETARKWILRADPVHLRTDVGTAYLFAEQHLELEIDEARQLAAALNEHLRDEGLELETPLAMRWYLRLCEDPSIRTSPPSLVAGREVGPFLPGGDEGGRWRRRFNEVQMLLHASAVNAAREAAGQLAVNSVWFWGGGEVPGPQGPQCAYDAVWSGHPLAAGAQALGWAVAAPAPPDPAQLFDRRAPGRHLMVIEDAYAAVLSNDVEGWRFALMEVERRWLAPLLARLDAGAVEEVVLNAALWPRSVSGSQGFAASRPGLLGRWHESWRDPNPIWEYLSVGETDAAERGG